MNMRTFRPISDTRHLTGIKPLKRKAPFQIIGDTFPHKEKLKEIGAQWDRKKKRWLFWKTKGDEYDALIKLLGETGLRLRKA